MDVFGRSGTSTSSYRRTGRTRGPSTRGQLAVRANPGITVTGYDEINGALTYFERQAVPEELRKGTRAAAKIVLKYALEIVRRRTGALAKSLKVRAIPARQRRKGSIGHQVVTSDAHMFRGDQFYAGFQELGTHDMEANPFLRPALYNNRDEIVGVFRAALMAAVEKTGAIAGRLKNAIKPIDIDPLDS